MLIKKKNHFTFATNKIAKSNQRKKKNLYFYPLTFYMNHTRIIRSLFLLNLFFRLFQNILISFKKLVGQPEI